MARFHAFFVGLCVLAPAGASAEAPRRMRADVPWALHPGDDLGLTAFERRYGVAEEDLPDVEPIWEGTLLYTKESGAREILEQQGLPPQHAVSYDASPGVLYVAMNGITLTGSCAGGETANSAKRCSALVDGETNFPPFGSSSQQAALFNQLADFYQPFDVVLTTSEPPEWMPYTMAVIGGSAGNAGQPGGVCGVANVQCDGLRRNHVSLTFPSSCGGSAGTAAQETAHNWGLEHTDNQNDLLYPFNGGGGAQWFVDDCMDISHATGDGVTQCDYIHEEYCPAGGGEQQNTYQELLGVFGPRTPDEQPPQIVEVFPEDGSTFTTREAFTVTARVEENSNFVAVRWSLEGGETTLSRCTNNVCDQDFNSGVGFDPSEVDWDFTTLTNPPPGEYVMTFEVLDAYGGYDAETITVTVIEAEGESGDPTAGNDDSGGAAETGTTGGDGGGGTGGPEGESDSGAMPGSDGGGGGADDDGGDDGGGDTEGLGATEGEEGCACNSGRPSGAYGFLGLVLAGLTIRRRRRA